MPDRYGRTLVPGDRLRWTYDDKGVVVERGMTGGYVLVVTKNGNRLELHGDELEWIDTPAEACADSRG